MNIFYVDQNPTVAAKMLCDRHVIKMILESAQLLSTAHRLLDGTPVKDGKRTRYVLYPPMEEMTYKLTHANHPSSVWVRQSHQHYEWLVEHALVLCAEYTKRYGKIHKTEELIRFCLSHPPRNIRAGCFLEPPQCMPEKYRQTDTVQAYRSYYIGEKARFATWKTCPPYWWNRQ